MKAAIAIAGIVIFGVSVGTSPARAQALPALALGVSQDEDYRALFDDCDGGTRMASMGIFSGRRWRGCSSDPNRLEALMRFPAKGRTGGAVLSISKLAVDLDGSWLACNKRGPTDQCPTSLMLKETTKHPCVTRGPSDKCVPVDSDRIPYVVIPAAGPTQAQSEEFRNRFGVSYGDYGVVIYRGKVVPVIVTDGGPHKRFGEGSLALHRELGIDYCAERAPEGHCIETSRRPVSIGSGVAMIVFPGSRDPRTALSPNTIASVVKMKGMLLYKAFMREYGQPHVAQMDMPAPPPARR